MRYFINPLIPPPLRKWLETANDIRVGHYRDRDMDGKFCRYYYIDFDGDAEEFLKFVNTIPGCRPAACFFPNRIPYESDDGTMAMTVMVMAPITVTRAESPAHDDIVARMYTVGVSNATTPGTNHLLYWGGRGSMKPD